MNVRIYFDTNMLETRHRGKKLSLSEFRFNRDFYSIIKFVEDNKLSSQVEVCIPEIVWEEIKVHMIQMYEEEFSRFSNDVEDTRKTFGSLLDVTYDFKGMEIEQYKTYVDELSREFWDIMIGKCIYVESPKDTETWARLAQKAVNSIAPFKVAGANNKKYTDAGFKDALICETIINDCNNSDLEIIMTKDGDYSGVFTNGLEHKIKIFQSSNSVIDFLAKRFEIDIVSDEKIKEQFKYGSYLSQQLLSDIGIELDTSITVYRIEKIQNLKEYFSIQIYLCVNEVEYKILLKYDSNANETYDIESSLMNE